MDDLTRNGGTVRFQDALKKLQEQSSVPPDNSEFNEAVRVLEQEGMIRVTGEGGKRVIRRLAGVV